MSDNYFKKGSWNVSCAICASTRKRDFVRPNRHGLLVCIDRNCWEPKHPIEKQQVTHGPDNRPVPKAQPMNYVFINSKLGVTTWEKPGLVWNNPLWDWNDKTTLDGNESVSGL